MEKPRFRVPKFKVKRGFSRKIFLSGIAIAVLIFSIFMYYDNFKYKVFVSNEIISNLDLLYRETNKLNELIATEDADIYEVILSIDRIERGLNFLYSSAIDLKRYSYRKGDEIRIEDRVCKAYSLSKTSLINASGATDGYDYYLDRIRLHNDSLSKVFVKHFKVEDGAISRKDYMYYSTRIVNRDVWVDFLMDLELVFSNF